MELTIVAPIPFSFAHNLDYLSRSENECLYHVSGGNIRKLVSIAGENLLLELTGDDHETRVRILDGKFNDADSTRSEITRFVRDWFDLERDLTAFYEMAENDALLREVVGRFHGLRIVGVPDLFEAMCWAILGQQINLAFAYTLKRRFVETFGSSVEFEGRRYWAFPSPHVIAELTVTDLTSLQITTKKSEYLIGVAKLMAAGELDKTRLLELDDVNEMEKALTRIHGIGPWTAHYVLMRCLRAPSAFPIADVGLHNAIKYVLGMDKKPSLEEIRHLSIGWSGWEAYATFYLWRCLY